jgi:hypothetical protein
MNKSKEIAAVPAQALRLMGQVLLGGLCGVGLLWTLTTAWPISRSYVHRVGDCIEAVSGTQPIVMVGLIVGTLTALFWQALKK